MINIDIIDTFEDVVEVSTTPVRDRVYVHINEGEVSAMASLTVEQSKQLRMALEIAERDTKWGNLSTYKKGKVA